MKITIAALAVLLPASFLIAEPIVINMTAANSTEQILPGNVTQTMRYTASVVTGPPSTLITVPNSYLGPVISVMTGDEMLVHFQNNLAFETCTHWHGLDVPDAADGHPKDAMAPGASYDYEFIVRNRAGTYWYHPHPDMMTGEQAYRGLASFFIVSDFQEQALDLPRGEYDIPLCIQDATFDANNQWLYNPSVIEGFFGTTTLINGQPNVNVNIATRMYRLRLLNGSQSKILKLSFLDGAPLVVIGVDGGLLEAPAEYPYVILGPGERVELWADFSTRTVGDVITLRTLAYSGAGPGQGVFENLMTFTVDRIEAETLTLPTTLVPMEEMYNPADAVASKTYPIDFVNMKYIINGGAFSMLYAALNEEAHGDDLELITFTNSGSMAIPHPMHFHGKQFQIWSRAGGGTGYNTVKDGFVDLGWKDTFVIMPGETVQLLMRWTRHPGLFVYHCHNLPHEDMGMMRNQRVFEPLCPNDMTHDGVVDVSDFLVVLGAWGTPFGDVTGDDRTNVTDILSIVGGWGGCMPPLRNNEPSTPILRNPPRKK